MKKLLFVLALVIMGSTFAKANVSVKNTSTTPIAFAKAVVQSNESFLTTSKFQKAQKVASGYITDSSGNRVGWWAYDDQSGVLLTYLY